LSEYESHNRLRGEEQQPKRQRGRGQVQVGGRVVSTKDGCMAPGAEIKANETCLGRSEVRNERMPSTRRFTLIFQNFIDAFPVIRAMEAV